jgi:four helix bundle protein
MTDPKEVTFDEWTKTLPEKLRSDPLWESGYYRLAMYLYDLVWTDSVLLKADFRGCEVAHQLIRSAGGICANIEEAYGRGVGTADYIRILRISLGEARETQGWYYRARHILTSDLLDRRINVLSQVIAMLVSTISRHRKNLTPS